MTARLLTIPPSHYCEKARWALQRAAIPFREERHPPILHYPAVRLAGGDHSTPTLIAGQQALSDSTDILRWIQAHPEARWRPYPDDPAIEAEAAGLEDHFDEALGPHVRRMFYFYIMPRRDLFVAGLVDGVGRAERWTFRALHLPIRAVMRRSMRIDDAGARRSRARIDEVFAEVDARLADGRRWLVGDRFTAADLTFASLGAMLVRPRQYAGGMELMGRLPESLAAELAPYRERPAGRFILRVYDEERLGA